MSAGVRFALVAPLAAIDAAEAAVLATFGGASPSLTVALGPEGGAATHRGGCGVASVAEIAELSAALASETTLASWNEATGEPGAWQGPGSAPPAPWSWAATVGARGLVAPMEPTDA